MCEECTYIVDKTDFGCFKIFADIEQSLLSINGEGVTLDSSRIPTPVMYDVRKNYPYHLNNKIEC